LGHPIGGIFGRVATTHHFSNPTTRTTAHPATAPIAISDSTNQISSGEFSIAAQSSDVGGLYRALMPAENNLGVSQ